MYWGKWLFIALIGLLGITKGLTVSAQEAVYSDSVIEMTGSGELGKLMDADRSTWLKITEDGKITVSRSDGIAALYVEFDRIPGEWMLTESVSGKQIQCGQEHFLHEYINVTELFGRTQQSLELQFAAGTSVADIYVFSEGELPDWVQRWEAPCEEADLLLLSSHSDDEQLFFAGILPLYAGERGLKVQVAYVVQHFDANGVEDHRRPHEQLDGLWTVGVRNYPIISEFPDLYAASKDREVAFAQASAVYENAGIRFDDFVEYITECLRRCKPLAVVSHDVNGEYGHGTHVLCAAALMQATEAAADEQQYPESAAEYGVWRTQKTYLHLYPDNPIEMNYDVTLEYFGGKTAFEVTQDGFACHKSQHWTWFYKWIYGTADQPITRAADIRTYSPCLFGLYDSQVGPDQAGGDFLENIVTYEEQAAREAEEKRLAEEARRAEEKRQEEARKAEEKRLEEEARKAREQAVREEEERLRLELERLEAEKRQQRIILGVTGTGSVVCVILSVVLYHKRRRRK